MVVSGQEEGNLCTNLYETKGKLSRGSHRQCMLIKFGKLLGLLGILLVAPEIYIKANNFFHKTFSFPFSSSCRADWPILGTAASQVFIVTSCRGDGMKSGNCSDKRSDGWPGPCRE
jgi:hypothetical protein